MTRFLRPVTFALLLTTSVAHADIAIVINHDSPVRQLSKSEAINIFMGRFRKLPNGSVALPIDQSALKSRFYRLLVNKDTAEINSYWARLVFSGQASPPQQAASLEEVTDIVMHNANALSNMEVDEVPASMRSVLTLRE